MFIRGDLHSPVDFRAVYVESNAVKDVRAWAGVCKGLVRASLMVEGAQRGSAVVDEARRCYVELREAGVHLVASNHPHLLGEMIARNGSS